MLTCTKHLYFTAVLKLQNNSTKLLCRMLCRFVGVVFFVLFTSVFGLITFRTGVTSRLLALSAVGKTEIVFSPGNKIISANVGDKFENVAKNAGVDIKYKCKKGECGTCEIKIDGKWTKSCQFTVPAVPKGENLRVTIPPAKNGGKDEKKKPAAFFSPASFLEGVVNNGLGVSECNHMYKSQTTRKLLKFDVNELPSECIEL